MNITKRILVADDQDTERRALREILRTKPGWEVIEAKDGEEAMDLLCDGHRPDLVLLDIRMPRLDGLQLLQRMRRDPVLRDTKVIITSGTRDKETIVALAKLSISGYLLKPYTAEKTLAAVQPIMDAAVADPGLFAKNLLCKTALLVDDDATERRAMLEIFKSEGGWEVISAQDGQDALDRLHAGLRPDLILADLRMPRMDGLTFIQRIRDDTALRTLRVVVISSDHDREKVRTLAELRISGYLLKPIDPAKVKALLQQAAGKPLAKVEETSTAP